jgi:glucose/arabinose dehydrogenase
MLLSLVISFGSSTQKVPTYASQREVTSKFDTGGGVLEVYDSSLRIDEVASGIDQPTSMTFLGPNDILVTEKNTGMVKRILNGSVLQEPVLDVNVANSLERGLLGIAAVNKPGTYANNASVFVYFTESREDGIDKCYRDQAVYLRCIEEDEPFGNRLYHYDLANNELVNPKLLLDLPATPNRHNGGPVLIGPDQNVYLMIGDIDHRTKSQNYVSGEEPDGTSGVLRITQGGQPVGEGILGEEHPINFYYAYGIRNSFGMDFDPVTGNLWDTENGPDYGDEVNLVLPGFNSGWRVIQGFAENEEEMVLLEDFGGRGKYSDPEFVWGESVGPTALKFLNSDKLGEQYENDMFVGDVHRGNIYHFELNDDRTGFVLQGNLEDNVGDTGSEMEEVIFGRNFGGISDIEVGPDGYLYIVSIGLGKIFSIVPSI